MKRNGPATRLEYLGMRVAVATGDKQLSDWLLEFLCPYFQVVSEPSTDAEIQVITDADLFDRMRRMAASDSAAQVVCFLRDSHALSLPCWQQRDGSRVVYDDKFRVFTIFAPERRRIEIVGACATRQLRVSVMRAIRELALIATIGKGSRILHAAALSTPAGGIAIIGPKFAGKTTLLLAGLAAAGSAFIANDRLVVRCTQTGVNVRGFPTIVSIRGGEPSFFPEIRNKLASSHLDHASSLSEMRGIADGKPAGPCGKMSMSAAQLCAALDVPLQAETKLGALIFPRIDLSKRRSEIQELAPKVAAEHIHDGRFRASAEPVERTVFSDFLGHQSLAPSIATQACDELATLLPAYRYTLAQDVMRQTDVAAASLARCLAR